LITLDNDDVTVKPLEVGKFFWASYELDISLDETDMAELILKNFEEPSNTILTVKLKGNAPFQKLERLKTTLRKVLSEFFWLYIDDRNARPGIDHSKYSESTVIGQFIKIMNDKIHHAAGKELEAQKEALKLGVGLLTGEFDKKFLSLEDFLRHE
jgi:MFS superfamily sulfate permease-like transporter